MTRVRVRPAPPEPRAAAAAGRYDAVVVGAGFGGLGAALRLAERGASVLLLETLSYPGGCASTFERGGARFEAGATLASGLDEEGLFRRWIERYGLDVAVDRIDPVVELRAPGLRLPVTRDRDALERGLAALPGAPREGLARFFARQRAVADELWRGLAHPRLLPPFDLSALLANARRSPRIAWALRDAGRPLARVLERCGVADFAPLRLFVDALCQITVQCPAAEAEAPLAMAALDYPWRGSAHVRGGIGRLAEGLVDALRSAGGDVRFGARARGVARDGDGWTVALRDGPVRARHVVANLLPQGLDALLADDVRRPARLGRLAREVERGWGACMLYLVLAPAPELGARARHLQLVGDPGLPLVEGNHLFCSLGEPDEGGRRTATVSTHVDAGRLSRLSDDESARHVAAVQRRMRDTLRALAPEVRARVVREHTASPRTFERFTGRPGGFVGGVPRRADLRNYLRVGGGTLAPGLHLVGDTLFPGQSALAAAVGGWKLAERLARAEGTRAAAADGRETRETRETRGPGR